MTTLVLSIVALALAVGIFFYTRNHMFKKFEHMAMEALRSNSEDLAKMGQADIDKKQLELEKFLQPFKHTLDEYRRELDELEKARSSSYQKVDHELQKVIEISSQLSKETSALKNALTRPHVRGRWGEMQLKNCVELAGMSEHSDVTFQDYQQGNEGDILIPDLTVRMPGGRFIVVDAKTPIDAFINSLEATEDLVRQTELKRHGKHVKEHIKKLSTRGYAQSLDESADFVVMFLPNEAFLYAALETEPDLMEYALQKKVLVATPPTLIGLLKVIRYGWNEEKLAENAARISEAGKELHKRLCDFVEAYTNVGKHLDKAQSEYKTGLTRLQSRVIVQAKRLESLGAKSHKELPEASTEVPADL